MDSGDPEVRNDLPLVEALKAYDALPMSEKTTITHQSPAYCYAKGWIAALNVAQAAHRAEVERAVAERDEAVALLANAITRVQSCITRSAELEKEYADGGYTESAAICRRQREEDNALLMRMDAAIRARGAKS